MDEGEVAGQRPRGRPRRDAGKLAERVVSEPVRRLIMTLDRHIDTAYRTRTQFVREACRRGYQVTDQQVSNAFGGRRERGPDWELTTCIVRCCVVETHHEWELGHVAALWAEANGMLRPPGYAGVLLPPLPDDFDPGDADEHLVAATKGIHPALPENTYFTRESEPTPLHVRCRRHERMRGASSAVWLAGMAATLAAALVSGPQSPSTVRTVLLAYTPLLTCALVSVWLGYLRIRADFRLRPVHGDIPKGGISSVTWVLPPGAVSTTTFRRYPRRMTSTLARLLPRLLWHRLGVDRQTPPLACVTGDLVLTDPDNPHIATELEMPMLGRDPNPAGDPIVEWMFTVDQTLLAIGVLHPDRATYTVAADINALVYRDSRHYAALRDITLAPTPRELRLSLRRIDTHRSTAKVHWNNPGLHVHNIR